MRLLKALALISVFLLMGAKVKKEDPILQPVGENAYVTLGDINDLNAKVNWWFLSVIGFVALEFYRTYQKRNDRTGETLEKLVKSVERIEGRLEHTPTAEEARQIARDEILHARNFQK